ncbi:MAG: STT3 domain-containing protein, partial [Promethearchaeota archaeon]
MIKIGDSLRNLRDRIRASVNVKPDNILFFMALSLVVIVAIMIRLTPILRGPLLIKAFDPWIQYYNAKYISEHSLYEYFHWHDEKSWYPEGKDRATLRPGLPFTAVIIYKILVFFGVPVTLYEVCYFFPAFMGGLTVLTAYFLGKEVYNRSCGLFTAFFLAFNTGHMQRTMAGFFDNETIGVFATLMTLLFFLKTIRTGRISYAIIGGMCLGYLSLSWGGYQFVFYILPIMVLIIVLMDKYNEDVLIAYAGVQGTGFLVFSLYYSFNHDEFFSDFSMGGVFLFTVLLIIFHLLYINKKEYPKIYYRLLNSVKWVIIPVIITLAIIMWVKPEWIRLEQFGLKGRLSSILSPLTREDMHLVASVAEHMPSAWSVFYYNTLIPLTLLPLGIFFCFKRLKSADILMITFLLTLFYFTGSMIRIILLFAPAASLMAAYGLVNVLKIFGTFIGEKRLTPIRKRRRQLRRSVGNSEVFAVYFLVGFLCLAQVLHATDISINQLSYSQMVIGGEYHDWEETLVWMKNNIDGTDVVVSWWDYGYWLTPVGNVTTVNDNNTHNGPRIGLVGMAMMQTNEIYSAKVLRDLEADYVLVYFGFLIPGFGGDEGKWPWMLRICNDHYEYYKDEGYEEDNWADDSVFIEDDYINETSGLYKEAWFNSQLVRLMFYNEPTSPSGVDPYEDYPRWYYASQIGGNPSQGISPREDNDGNEWKDHIPSGGAYDFKIFKEAYFSKHGLVKLYKVDYTALDSSFSIENEEVFDQDAATFNLRNTGTKDLTITNVAVNNIEYNFTLGSTTNELNQGEEIPVWVDITEDYALNDVVNISVTAQSIALDGKPYVFKESTKDFFVTKAKPGDIRINKENSKVVQNGPQSDVYLEVENVGNRIENLNEYYFDTESNIVNPNRTEYITGASVLNPGTKSLVKISNAPADFFIPDSVKGHLIGVKTSSGETDEVLFSGNSLGYELSILNQDRRLSPEALASGVFTYRTHIPLDFDDSGTFVYNNGSMRIRIKNTGSGVLGLDSVYIGKANSVKYGNIYNLTASNYI